LDRAPQGPATCQNPVDWDLEADVVVIGAGATGLPAAIVAREAGCSVILVEAEKDIGGHAIISGGNVPLGGGTSVQRKYGIADTPDLLFRDLTDWSVVGPNGFPDYRYNDREIIRAFADNSAPCFEWLLAHGVEFIDRAPDHIGGNSVPREMHSIAGHWPMPATGRPADPEVQKARLSGNGMMRSLEIAARSCGVEILLEHRMTRIYRQSPNAGPVLGIAVDRKGGRPIDIRARKAVIVGTGGSTGNVNFHRMFDPRLTEEYCGLAGMPWSDQDASGEVAAMAIGAALWGFYNQIGEFGSNLTKPLWSAANTVTGTCNGSRGAPSSTRRGPAVSMCGIGRTSSASTCSAAASTTRLAGNTSPTTTTRSRNMFRATGATCSAANTRAEDFLACRELHASLWPASNEDEDEDEATDKE
jgi:hypothetical protein